MSAELVDLTPAVLANEGVPITLVVNGAQTPHRLRFSCNSIADVEHKYGSVSSFQERMSDQPMMTTRDVMAIVLGHDPSVMGDMMLPNELQQYTMAVQIAWALAMGVDPTQAIVLISKMRETSDSAARQLAESIDRDLADLLAASSGQTGSPDGSGSAAQ